MSTVLFLLGLMFCLTPWASPPLALALGLALALTTGNPFHKYNGKLIKYLLQISVVGLGFGLNFSEVITAGKTGILFTAVSILGTLAVGLLIGRWLSINRKTSFLISSGTAICGGSAIAAMSSIIDADEKEVAIALGTVFILNAIALFIFPPLGHWLGLSAKQFGMWAAIAIHDTSSVVGAAAHFGDEALKIATTVKLTRALWIIPLSLVTAAVLRNRSAKISFPYFILGFVLASLLVTFIPSWQPAYSGLVYLAKLGLTVTLFLIGAGLSRATLSSVGVKPVVQGVLLWLLISTVSLVVVWGVV